jgi:hypothetical protein
VDMMTLLVTALAAAAILLIAIGITTTGGAVSEVERYIFGSEGGTQRGSSFGRFVLVAGLILAAVWFVLVLMQQAT